MTEVVKFFRSRLLISLVLFIIANLPWVCWGAHKGILFVVIQSVVAILCLLAAINTWLDD